MDQFSALQDFFFSGHLSKDINSFFYSSNRGEASARLAPLLKETTRYGFDPDASSLIVSSIGELSNNCFDHNVGYWGDVAGCCLTWSFANELLTVGLADRGRGIVNSLRPVAGPSLDSSSVIKIAFEQIMTGRAPENRGNGLKYVRRSIEASSKNSLIAFSNDAVYSVGTIRLPALSALPRAQGIGTLIYTQWSLK